MMSLDLEAQAGVFVRRAIEFILAFGILLFGLVLSLFPGGMAHPIYDPMTAILPERIWATWMVGMGSTRALALIINGHWPLSPIVRVCYSAASMATVWWPFAMIFLIYFKDYITGAGGAVLPGLVLSGIACFTEALCIYVLMALREARKRGR